METSNTYMGHDNVLIHVIEHPTEHNMVLTLDIIFQHSQTGKWSDIINVYIEQDQLISLEIIKCLR